MMRRTWMAVLALFIVQSLASAEDAYAIKVKEPSVGDVCSVEASQTGSGSSKVTDAAGKVLFEQAGKPTTETFTYKETILAQETGKRPTRLRREYTKAETREGDKTTPYSFQGKTLLIEEKKDGKFHFQDSDGKELTSEEAAPLDKVFNQRGDEESDSYHLLLTGKSVAPGESWKVEMKPVVKNFSQSSQSEIDVAKSTGKGELRKVYMKDNYQFGVVHCQLDMPMQAINHASGKSILDPGSAATMVLDVDGCIDGRLVNVTSKTELTMQTVEAIPTANGGKAKLAVTIHLKQVQTVTELPKK